MHAVPFGRRNLLQDRRRAALAIGGLSVALVLVLVLGGVFAGALGQVTNYLRHLPADVIVSQRDVKTMHMSASALPPETVNEVARVPGVAQARAIRFTTNTIGAGNRRQLSYVIGYDTRSSLGGPNRLTTGHAPRVGEAVLDDVAADQLHVKAGDDVSVLGRTFRISGLSTGGTSITNTTTFIRTEDFAARRGTALSYILVSARPGVGGGELVRRIQAALPTTTAQTRSDMVSQEGHIVRDMSADIMQMMTVIAFVIALAVVALTLFTATNAKLREYAVVKALGARPRRLVGAVMSQAGWTIGLAFVTSIALTFGIGVLVGAVSPTVRIVVEPGAVVRLGLVTVVIGLVGALIPLRRVFHLDPNSVFRRSS